jgi:hypothetical protein
LWKSKKKYNSAFCLREHTNRIAQIIVAHRKIYLSNTIKTPTSSGQHIGRRRTCTLSMAIEAVTTQQSKMDQPSAGTGELASRDKRRTSTTHRVVQVMGISISLIPSPKLVHPRINLLPRTLLMDPISPQPTFWWKCDLWLLSKKLYKDE